MSYLSHFIAKAEQADAPLPQSFCVRSLGDFAGDLEEGSLPYPLHALRAYLELTKSMVVWASTLFVFSLFSISHLFKEHFLIS